MKSRTFKMFSARAAMLMLATLFSAGAWAQSQDLLPPENETNTLDNAYQRSDGAYKLIMHGSAGSDAHIGPTLSAYEIEYKRTFTVGVPATVIFPFSTAKMTVTGGSFYEFAGVEWDSEQGKWVASMTQVDANALAQNKPYMVLPSENKLTFEFSELIEYSTGDDVAAVTCDCWSFVGTYKKLYWIEKGLTDADLDWGLYSDDFTTKNSVEGDFYGFAAFDNGDVSAGEFVKCTGNGTKDNSAFIMPLRAYLQYVGDENCPANNDTQMIQRSAAAILPTSIAVVLRDKNGEVTSVGTTSEKTGEITFEGWFTIDGIKLPAEPTKSGVYIHNGKKVVVK